MKNNLKQGLTEFGNTIQQALKGLKDQLERDTPSSRGRGSGRGHGYRGRRGGHPYHNPNRSTYWGNRIRNRGSHTGNRGGLPRGGHSTIPAAEDPVSSVQQPKIKSCHCCGERAPDLDLTSKIRSNSEKIELLGVQLSKLSGQVRQLQDRNDQLLKERELDRKEILSLKDELQQVREAPMDSTDQLLLGSPVDL